MSQDVAEIAKGLTEAQRSALMAFPRLRDARPAQWKAAVTFGGLWRKLPKHWDAMLDLKRLGLVERRVTRGEALWRPTRPLGLAVRDHLERAG